MSGNTVSNNIASHMLGHLWRVKALIFQVGRGSRSRIVELQCLSRLNGRNELLLSTLLKGHLGVVIYTTIVNIEFAGKTYFFHLSYRFHSTFMRNCALTRVHRESIWLGDMVVVKMGVLSEYAGMSGGNDRKAAERAVCGFLREVGPRINQALASQTIVEFPQEVYVSAAAANSMQF